MSLFSVKQLTKRFGSVLATNHVDLEIEEEGILSIIGPNGAGKTTFFNLLHRFPQTGRRKHHLQGKGHGRARTL